VGLGRIPRETRTHNEEHHLNIWQHKTKGTRQHTFQHLALIPFRILSRVMSPSLIIMGYGLDLLTPSLTISLNHNQSSAEHFFLDCRELPPFSYSFDSVLYYLYSIWVDPQKTPLPLLLYLQHHCTETEVTRLLPAYSLSRECVYRVVA
jgi:hypothetical protein